MPFVLNSFFTTFLFFGHSSSWLDYTTFETISTIFLTIYTLYQKKSTDIFSRLFKNYAFCKLLFNISLYSLLCSVVAGFRYGYAGAFLVPSSTSLCYRKSFLSSTSYTLPLCKFGVHFNPFWISGTLGDIIALLTLNLYALQ